MNITEDYTGHVQPGGAAARRHLDALTITKLSVGPLDNNAYLLTCRSSGETLLIDAANEAKRLLDLIGHQANQAKRGTAELRTILTTHRHG
ncbi:MAG: MBL fold metallo-hydrolase, partial [Actinomycetota bacterium]|nr:MBL fold metallo-hydrolase [Actinomycetota bacterium]